MINKTLIIIILIIFYGAQLKANEGAAATLHLPIGARAAAMGGVGVAATNDPTAIYWNPARLGLLKQINISSTYFMNSLGDNGGFEDIAYKDYFVAVSIPLGRLGVLGVGWKYFSIGDIERRGSDKEQLGYFDNNQNTFFFAYALELVPEQLYIGFHIKHYQEKFSGLKNTPSAQGTGLTIGLSYRPARYLAFGLRADDDFAVKWGSENANVDQALYRGIAGMGLFLWKERILLAFDLEQTRNRPLKGNFGLELANFFFDPDPKKSFGVKNFALRAGLDDLFLEERGSGIKMQDYLNYTFGFGLEFSLDKVNLALDYSFGSYYLGNQNRFSFLIHF